MRWGGVSLIVCMGCPWAMILPISTSQVPKITGMNHFAQIMVVFWWSFPLPQTVKHTTILVVLQNSISFWPFHSSENSGNWRPWLQPKWLSEGNKGSNTGLKGQKCCCLFSSQGELSVAMSRRTEAFWERGALTSVKYRAAQSRWQWLQKLKSHLER